MACMFSTAALTSPVELRSELDVAGVEPDPSEIVRLGEARLSCRDEVSPLSKALSGAAEGSRKV